MKFYTLDRILSECPDAQYYVIFGGRSHGKTYSALLYGLQRYVETGERMALIRRYYEDFKGKRSLLLWENLVENGEISRVTGGKWEYVFYRSGAWYLAKNEWNDKKKESKRIKEEMPFCFAYPLIQMEHDKGSRYTNSVTTIIFDEFMSRNGYLPDEFSLFSNTISTIKGFRHNVKIFMLGNTVSQYCPYFSEMGLSHIKEMKAGEIAIYRFTGDNGAETRVAVEYTNLLRESKQEHDEYFGFDNPKLRMITSGDWEFALYPHLPVKYKRSDILFTFFILFNGDTLQCNIINVTDDNGVTYDFIYIHHKTTPLKFPDDELIYSQEYNAKPNYRRKLTQPQSQGERKILSYFHADKVFYQDNQTGEIIRNYFDWCITE